MSEHVEGIWRSSRETLMKTFPAPSLCCEAAYFKANPGFANSRASIESTKEAMMKAALRWQAEKLWRRGNSERIRKDGEPG